MQKIHVIILAAGLGKRMKSQKPKVLHELGGITLVEHVVRMAGKLNPKKIYLVVPKKHEAFEDVFTKEKCLKHKLCLVVQKHQRGTADAVKAASDHIKEKNGTVLVLNGDQPLITVQTVKRLATKHIKNKSVATLLTESVADPYALGRIIRDKQGNMLEVVEEKDATLAQKKIKEINVGNYVFDLSFLKHFITSIDSQNKQKEFYLPDLVRIGVQKGYVVSTDGVRQGYEAFGINSQVEMRQVRQIFYEQQVEKYLKKGVAIYGDGVCIDTDVKIAQGVCIEGPCYIKSETVIDKDVVIEMGSVIKSSKIGKKTMIKAHSYIDHSKVGSCCQIGPFAHLRPLAHIKNRAKIGNFVEVKKSVVGEKSKVNHLSYIGDAQIGNEVNVGAGTITCNYDGYKKFKTVLADRVFVGSDTQLVAPVKIGEGAIIGAGTTVTKNVSKNSLVISRTYQKEIPGWAQKKRQENN